MYNLIVCDQVVFQKYFFIEGCIELPNLNKPDQVDGPNKIGLPTHENFVDDFGEYASDY